MHHPYRLAVALAACGFATHAVATNVFRLEGYGPISRGMGGTSAAYDIGSAALLDNPATLGLGAEGAKLDLGLDLVITSNIKVTDTATGESVQSKSKDLGSAYYAPEAGYVHRSGPLTWGIGAFAGGGLGTEYGTQSFLSRTPGGINTGLENASRLLVLEIPVGVSYAVNDRLTVGAALEAMWTGMNLELLLGANQVVDLIGHNRATGSLVPVLGGIPGLEGAHFSLSKGNDIQSGVNGWGWDGRLGMTFRVSDSTRFGAAYTMKSHLADLKGRAQLTAISSVAGQIALKGDIRIVDFQMPDVLTVGVAHQATDSLLLAADVSRIGWKGVMQDIKVHYTADGGGDLAIQLPQNYRDVTLVNLGAAWRVDKWTLRAGVSHANQAIPGDMMFAVIPATPTDHLTLGFAYDFNKNSTINFAYSHALKKTLSNSSLPNASTAAPISVEHTQDNFVLGYSYRF